MCRAQCMLALAALSVGLAHSWDIAVSLGDQLLFYTDDGIQTNTVNFNSYNLTSIVYDEVHNTILYVDKQSNDDGICGYNLLSKDNTCFIRRIGNNIHDIAFDPATETVFFTDTNERSINLISLKPESNNTVNLLIKMDDRTPSDIAVDSCSGYIYWTNKNVTGNEYVERARFNGSDREVVYQYLDILSFVMDSQSRKMYYVHLFGYYKSVANAWADINRNKYYFEYFAYYKLAANDLADIYRYNDYVIFTGEPISVPKELTVSNDYLYWMNSSNGYNAVWQVPKNATHDVKPKEISKFYLKSVHGIAANYKIKDQIEGLQDCEVLSLKPPVKGTNNSLNIQQTTETDLSIETELTTEQIIEWIREPEQTTEHITEFDLRVHGINVSETSVSNCTPGYIGGICDVSVCENYCLQGDCSLNDEGLPKCRCNAGYSGTRCEVYACHGYCLNNGVCSLNKEDEPVCQCVGNHEGIRCEAVKDATIIKIPTYDSAKTNLILAYKPNIYIYGNK